MSFKEQIKKFIDKNNLQIITLDLFWKNFDSYLIENPEEARKCNIFNRESIKIIHKSVSYELINDSNEMFVITLNMYNTSDNYIGYYSACFDMNGILEDDFFVIE